MYNSNNLRYSRVILGGDAPGTRVGQVTEVSGSLFSAISRLEDSLGRLATQLAPVLRQEPGTDAKMANFEQLYPTPFADVLNGYRYQVTRLEDCVEDILNRLEI